MKLRYFILLAAVPLVGLASGEQSQTALAQTGNETVRFKNVALWVNPEYDDPRLLVMLEGNLDGATAPVRVSFMVPSAAEMYSAGSMDAQGKYSGGPPDRVTSEIPGWDIISYELKTDTFRVEYYNPAIQGYPDKTISYDFLTISTISDLRVIIQQPKQSFDFTVTPKGAIGGDGENFTVSTSSFNDVTSETPLHFAIAYNRTETKPSVGLNPALNPDISGDSNSALIIGVILGISVIGVGVVWVLKSRQTRPVPVRGGSSPGLRTSRQERRRAVRQPGQGNRFCTQCGEPINASDRFCPSCGAKLRN